MASLIENEAHFEKKCREVRLSSEVVTGLRGQGFVTLAQLAYAVGQPGQVIPPDDFEAFCQSVEPRHSAADKASLLFPDGMGTPFLCTSQDLDVWTPTEARAGPISCFGFGISATVGGGGS